MNIHGMWWDDQTQQRGNSTTVVSMRVFLILPNEELCYFSFNI